MSLQQIEYIRGCVSLALADLHRSGKGQLAAFEDSPLARTTKYKRKRLRVVTLEGRTVCADTDPLPSTETRSRKGAPPLIEPETFITCSWRRAILTQKSHHKGWLLWCYAHDLDFDYQVSIVHWGWGEFEKGLNGRRIAVKTRDRLRSMAWLAAQDVKDELHGWPQHYRLQDLAKMLGVDKSTFTTTYLPHWKSLRGIFLQLDRDALLHAQIARKVQKADNYQHVLAKSN